MARTCNRKHAHEARRMDAPEARCPRRRPANPTRAPGKRRTPIALKPSGDGLPSRPGFCLVPVAVQCQRPASAPISNDTVLDVALVHPDATDQARAGRDGLFRAPRHGRFRRVTAVRADFRIQSWPALPSARPADRRRSRSANRMPVPGDASATVPCERSSAAIKAGPAILHKKTRRGDHVKTGDVRTPMPRDDSPAPWLPSASVDNSMSLTMPRTTAAASESAASRSWTHGVRRRPSLPHRHLQPILAHSVRRIASLQVSTRHLRTTLSS